MTGDFSSGLELTILMPCLNEAETLAICIDKAQGFLKRTGISGEVLVADNGSSDGSQDIAQLHGARVEPVSERGYGAALLGGIRAAQGRYVIMGDADDSYDFSQLENFVAKLREGYDLVMGNRFKGGIAAGAMPPLHRYLGNPVLSGIGRLFFTSQIGDFHCGLRGFNRESMQRIGLRTTGMEFASEMVVKATLQQLRITEVPTTLAKDGRNRPPHLRSWRDGWRHLRFLLMYAPRWLFLYPGLFLILLGVGLIALVLPGPLQVGTIVFDVHTLLLGSAALLTGTEILLFFLLAKQYAISSGILPEGTNFRLYREITTLERAVLLGAILVLGGLIGIGWAILAWQAIGFGQLDYAKMMRLLVPSIAALALGVQIVMASFLSGILDLKVTQDSKEILPDKQT